MTRKAQKMRKAINTVACLESTIRELGRMAETEAMADAMSSADCYLRQLRSALLDGMVADGIQDALG